MYNNKKLIFLLIEKQVQTLINQLFIFPNDTI